MYKCISMYDNVFKVYIDVCMAIIFGRHATLFFSLLSLSACISLHKVTKWKFDGMTLQGSFNELSWCSFRSKMLWVLNLFNILILESCSILFRSAFVGLNLRANRL